MKEHLETQNNITRANTTVVQDTQPSNKVKINIYN
jgi:hypothetical protein